MRGAGRRRPKVPDPKPPPISTPISSDPWQLTGGRDSDASFCSSRPSSSGMNRSTAASIPITDRSYQLSALRSINNYLSSHSSSISLKPPLPSAKDITEAFRFILTRLDFSPSNKLDEDLFSVLKLLNCPIKLNKSALRAPGTPHAWPSLLAVMHWLVQTAMCCDELSNSTQTRAITEGNSMYAYSLKSYLHYIVGDDDSVDSLDREFMDKLQQEIDSVKERSKNLEGEAMQLEAKLERLKTEPSAKEVMEKEKNMLEEDVKKFHAMIEQLSGHKVTVEKMIHDKEKELGVKIEENMRKCDENEELKKTVEEQAFNARDAERMKRELQAVEREIEEAESARNAWEEKAWEADAEIGHKLKELEALLDKCNQAIRRLKLGNNIQYVLNPKGSTAVEVLGIDYKSTLQPTLGSLAEEIKNSSMAKLEEQIHLEQMHFENAAKVETKRNHIAALQSRIDKEEVQLNQLKQEGQDYISRCASEARKLVEDSKAESHKMDLVEKEATELLQSSKVKLQEAIAETEEEVQMCARELFQLVDSVSKYKEYTAAKISEMKNDLVDTVGAISDKHKKSSVPAHFLTRDESN